MMQDNVKKRFSVLVPVYNREEYISQAIDSVLSQTFTDYELIVVDDGSSDRTPDVLRSYGARIKVVRQANQGPEVARNIGASMANGEYLAFLDSDDLFLPCALATYDKIIMAFDSPALILGAMGYFMQGQDIPTNVGCEDIVEVLKYRDFLSKDVGIGLGHSKIVIRKSIFQEVGGQRNSTPETFHLEDYHMMLRTGTYGPCVIVKQPTTILYRRHATNSLHNIEASVRGVFSLINSEHRGDYPGGRSRRFARYARIGGSAYEWIWKAWANHLPGLAFRLLISSSPMIMAAALRKLWFLFNRTTTPVILPYE